MKLQFLYWEDRLCLEHLDGVSKSPGHEQPLNPSCKIQTVNVYLLSISIYSVNIYLQSKVGEETYWEKELF